MCARNWTRLRNKSMVRAGAASCLYLLCFSLLQWLTRDFKYETFRDQWNPLNWCFNERTRPTSFWSRRGGICVFCVYVLVQNRRVLENQASPWELLRISFGQVLRRGPSLKLSRFVYIIIVFFLSRCRKLALLRHWLVASRQSWYTDWCARAVFRSRA